MAVVYYNLGNAYMERRRPGAGCPELPARRGAVAPRPRTSLPTWTWHAVSTVDQLAGRGRFPGGQRGGFRATQWATTTEYGLAALLLWAAGAGMAISVLIVRPDNAEAGCILRGGAAVALRGHAHPASAAAKHALLQPLRQHRRGHRRDGGSAERTGVAVRRRVHLAQRRPGTAWWTPATVGSRSPCLAANWRAGSRPTPSRSVGPGRRWVSRQLGMYKTEAGHAENLRSFHSLVALSAG